MTNEMNNEKEMDDFEKELSSFDEDYKEASGESEFTEVPDGNYDAWIERAEVKNSKTSGKPMLSMQLRVIGGSQNNRVLFRNSVIQTPENVKYIKQDLTRLGIELEKFSDLPKHLGEMLDLKVEVQKKTSGEYTNIYIQKCHGKIDTSEMGSTTGSDVDFEAAMDNEEF